MSEQERGIIVGYGFHRGLRERYTDGMDADAQTHGTSEPSAGPVDLGVLLNAIARQDEDALACFYDATAARAYALILRITQSVTLAEDVMSDVYLQVWQQAERFDGQRGNAQAWLFMLCRSRALDQLRRRDPAMTHAQPESLCNDLSETGGPLDLLLALDRHSAVHAAICQLADGERQLLALAFFRGLSHQEIAEHTGMPLGSVKTVLRKALLTLKARLIHHAPSPGGVE